MTPELYTTLISTLAPHFCLSKTRLMTLAVLILGLANGRTVNLSHISSQFPGTAKHSSNYRRLQRFFQFVCLDQDTVARIIVHMLNLSRATHLAIDRTNWKVGTKDINVLVLAIVTRRFRIPILWTPLSHRGNSNTPQRIALMQRYLKLFPASSIKLLLADREFIGAKWMEFLNQNNIPFAIRIKPEQRMKVPGNAVLCSIKTLLRGKRARKTVRSWSGCLQGRNREDGVDLSIAAKQLPSGEWLIIATNSDKPKQALNAYKKRWGIECLFGDTKTRGLNLEDTRIVAKTKIATLVAIVSLAMTWAYRCATRKMGRKAIPQKAHGRRQQSWFRVGFDCLRNWIIFHPDKAIKAWIDTCPKQTIAT